MPQKKLLLVEGPNDKYFFEAFLRKNSLEKIIATSPAKELGGTYNSKQGAINLLPSLAQNLTDGSIERLGVILDSDTVENGGGLTLTLKQLAEKIEIFGYANTAVKSTHGGYLFKNKDGLPPIGAWIMPNNKDEGSIENWISHITDISQRQLFTLASQTVNQLKTPLFPATRTKKAEVATWLAWQEIPGKGLDYTITGELLNNSDQQYINLLNWIKEVFL